MTTRMRIEARESDAVRLVVQRSLVTGCLKVRPVCSRGGGLSSLARVNRWPRCGRRLAPSDTVAYSSPFDAPPCRQPAFDYFRGCRQARLYALVGVFALPPSPASSHLR